MKHNNLTKGLMIAQYLELIGRTEKTLEGLMFDEPEEEPEPMRERSRYKLN